MDVVRLAAEQAAIQFGGHDGTFNAASFSNRMARISMLKTKVDGLMVRAILCGRSDIEEVGPAHYRVRRQTQ